jgi:galactonate dehydratase
VRITSLQHFLVLDRPRPALYVVIETEDGLSGVGEASINQLNRAAAGMLADLEPVVVGQDSREIERLWQLGWRRLFYRGGPVHGAALAAIDMALWDLKGKRAGLPVYELLGGLARDRVRLYVHIGGTTPEEAAAGAVRAVQAGYTAVRFSPFQATDGEGMHEHGEAHRLAVAQMAAIRKAVGESVEILLECHGRPDPHWAVLLGRAVEPYRPFLLEDPVRPENDEVLRRVRQQVAVPLASGERCHSKWEFRPLIEGGLVDYIRPDVCHCGGITEVRKVAAMAEAHQISLILHNVNGPVATAAGLHLAFALPNVTLVEAPWALEEIRSRVAWPYPRVENGYAFPPQGAGLGVTLDREALAAAPFQGRPLPDIRARDGSVQEW